jgi:endonuclease/exonuclease/phosphatase family metal-dependent hydrolase
MRVPGKNTGSGEKNETPAKRTRKPGTSLYLLRFSIVSALFTICLYYCCTIRPEKFWMAGFSGFLVPAFILLQVLLLAFWLWKKPIAALIPGLALLLGMRFVQASIGWHYLITEKCHDFKVLSLNARAFGAMAEKNERVNARAIQSIENLLASEADVICIQEMYDFPGVRPFNIIRTMKKAGYTGVFYSIARKHWGSSVGMAVFSKHPILEKQIIRKKEGSNNQIILARIKIGERRISVYNIHLQSVAISDKDLPEPEDRRSWLQKSLSIGKKLKKGFQMRASQMDELLSSAESEGDYVVICGDMNDTPYSNAYLRIRDRYRNAFEEKGKGLGFTFNGPIPFLRIDNQFFGKGLRTTRFETKKAFPASDHHGTEACYAFNE